MLKRIGIAIGIGLLALILRLPGLGTFMTADEPNWMVRSSQFYHALFRDGNPGGTFITSHPGVTAMWVIGVGEFIQEARLGIAVDQGNLKDFRLAATLPVAIATSLLIGIAVWHMAALWGGIPTLAAGVLLAADPYLTGMSQIAHLDALLALLMLNAVLSFIASPSEGEVTHRAGGVLCGIFTGLALATKLLPAVWLLLFFAFVLLPKRNFHRLFFIGGVAALTFYLLWPALWVKADIGHTLGRDASSIIQQEHVQAEAVDPISPASFYARALLGRTPPWVLILAAGAILIMIPPLTRGGVGGVFWLVFYVVGYLFLITFAAKKADRYALPALITLPILAGWGVATLLNLTPRPIGGDLSFVRRGSRFAMVICVLAVISYTFLLSPYAIAYNNPWFLNIRPPHQQGWGEGLDEAAAWLNQHPLGEKLTVASWYPSVLATYFQGKTFSLSSRDDARVGYVVTYRNMDGRGEDDQATAVLQEFSRQQPDHVITIQNIPYVWIYGTIGLAYFDRHTDELFGSLDVGQTIAIDKNNWGSIDIGLATFSSRNNTEDIILHVRENPEALTDIRTVTLHARQVMDSDWNRFIFDPITNSAGQTYYVFLTSPSSSPGNAMAIRYTTTDIRSGRMYVNQAARSGDIAYRIP